MKWQFELLKEIEDMIKKYEKIIRACIPTEEQERAQSEEDWSNDEHMVELCMKNHRDAVSAFEEIVASKGLTEGVNRQLSPPEDES